MKIYSLALVFVLVNFAVCVQVQAIQELSSAKLKPVGKNLISNSDFSLAEDQQPADWKQNTWSGDALFQYVTDAGHDDKTCVKIKSSDGADASWSFTANVKPKTNYQLSAWIKTKNLDTTSGGFGAQLNLHQLQLVGKSKPLKGTHDWTKVTTRFNSAENTELLVNLLFGGWGRSTGEAFFDDVELFELVEPLPIMNKSESVAFFENKVRPILEKNCFQCHGEDPEDLDGELALISRKMILEGGDSGPAVNLDAPHESLFVDVINYGTYKMPPTGKLPQTDIDTLTLWVKLGVPWTESDADMTIEREHSPSVPQVNEETKQFWSFQKVDRPRIPNVVNKTWASNEIDNFILSKLEQVKLNPAKPATKQSLIRRAYYDLTGLPPTPDEVDAFIKDPDPQAYEKLIDKLLASPHYGEKWGRHWLDVVRYAESNSFERDGTKPFIWHYRDYIIRAFNDDKPYDQFLLEQLAGDEIENPTAESITATGYYRLGQWDDEPADKQQALYDDLDDILATTSQAMMGLTINCARCHDHKIDPIPAADYYSMLAFFQNVRRYGVRGHDTVIDASTRQIGRLPTDAESKAYQDKLSVVQAKMAKMEDVVKADFESVEHEDFQYDQNKIPLVKKRVGKKVITQKQFNEYQNAFNRYKNLRDNPPHLYRVLCVKEHQREPPPAFVLVRGNPGVKGQKVEPAFVSVLSPPKAEITKPKNSESAGRRLALANWIIDPQHPLTSRVMVNRIWQHHFGRGIVRTANDFGFQGDKPTHPELLDWLADEFIDNEWSVKAMHRLIMTSSAYRMSCDFNENADSTDPLNNLFWRFEMRRLTAEEVRDSILAVSGRLNRNKMYGQSIYPKLSKEVLAGQSRPGDGWGNSPDADQRRRSIYIHVKRSLQVPLLANFDSADTDFTCPVRFNTTQPTQALGLLNSAFTNNEAREFAKIISQQFEGTDQQVREILRRVTQRPPTDDEIQRGVRLIKEWQSEDAVSSHQALAYFCLLSINLNEFIFID